MTKEELERENEVLKEALRAATIDNHDLREEDWEACPARSYLQSMPWCGGCDGRNARMSTKAACWYRYYLAEAKYKQRTGQSDTECIISGWLQNKHGARDRLTFQEAWMKSTEPVTMLKVLEVLNYRDVRVLRQFASWCADQVRPLLDDPLKKKDVEDVERKAAWGLPSEDLIFVRNSAKETAIAVNRETFSDAFQGNICVALADELRRLVPWEVIGTLLNEGESNGQF